MVRTNNRATGAVLGLVVKTGERSDLVTWTRIHPGLPEPALSPSRAPHGKYSTGTGPNDTNEKENRYSDIVL